MLCLAGGGVARGGTGADKPQWAADFFGGTKLGWLTFLGVCKMAALLDLWVTNIIPRVAAVCVAIMMAIVTYGHYMIPDDLPPPIVFTCAALVCAATWPSPVPVLPQVVKKKT